MIVVRDITSANPATQALPPQHVATSARAAGGGVITPHRALASVQLGRADLFLAVATGVAMTLVALLLCAPLFDAWRWMFQQVGAALGLEAQVRAVPFSFLPDLPVPYAVAQPPGSFVLVVAGVVAVSLFAGAQLLGASALPTIYLLRALATVVGSAVFVFALRLFPESFSLGSYAATALKVSVAMWLTVPLALGGTLMLLNVPWWKKSLLIVAALVHLAVLIPLQLLLTLYVTQHLSLIMLPLIFVFFSAVPQIGALIALYSWGASWAEAKP